jgi:hypothetical protein
MSKLEAREYAHLRIRQRLASEPDILYMRTHQYISMFLGVLLPIISDLVLTLRICFSVNFLEIFEFSLLFTSPV